MLTLSALELLLSPPLITLESTENGLEKFQAMITHAVERHRSHSKALVQWALGEGRYSSQSKDRDRKKALLVLSGVAHLCDRSFLQGYIQKLASLIQPAISSNKDKDCQVYALKLWTGLLEKSKSDETSTVGPGHSNEIKSALVELLPRGIPLLLTSMAVPISDQEIAYFSLKCLAANLRYLKSATKPYAAKVESTCLRIIEGGKENLESLATECICLIPTVLGDTRIWTTSVQSLCQQMYALLRQLSPDCSSPCPILNAQPTSLIFTPLPSSPMESVFHSSLLRFTRLSSLLQRHLHPEFCPSPPPLLLPPYLTLLQLLLRPPPPLHETTCLIPKTPTSLPPAYLHLLIPTLYTCFSRLFSELFSCDPPLLPMYYTRAARLLLLSLSLPQTYGLRTSSYLLLEKAVKKFEVGSIDTLTLPALELLLLDLEEGVCRTASTASGNTSNTVVKVKEQDTLKSAVSTRKSRKRARPNVTIVEVGRGDGDGGWGKEEERSIVSLDLLDAGLRALHAIVLCCGSLLPLEARLRIEKFLYRGVLDLGKGVLPTNAPPAEQAGILRTCGKVRASFVKVVVASLLTPLSDGTGSALIHGSASLLPTLCMDYDPKVAEAALIGRGVVETLVHPRGFPLVIPPKLLRVEEEEEEEEWGWEETCVPTSTSAPPEEEGVAETKKSEEINGSNSSNTVVNNFVGTSRETEEAGSTLVSRLREMSKEIEGLKADQSMKMEQISLPPVTEPRRAVNNVTEEEEEEEDALPEIVDEGPDMDDDED